MNRPDPDQLALLTQLAREEREGSDPRRAAGYSWLLDEYPEAWEQARAAASGAAEFDPERAHAEKLRAAGLNDAEIEADHAGRAAADASYPGMSDSDWGDNESYDWHGETNSDHDTLASGDGPDVNAQLRDELSTPSLDAICAQREELGRKFEPYDMTPGLKTAARELALAYEGDFDFMLQMRETMQTRGTLSDGQCKGVLNAVTGAAYRAAAPAQSSDPVTDEGFYMHEGDIYRVKLSQAGRLYAMRWTPQPDFDCVACGGSGEAVPESIDAEPRTCEECKPVGSFEYDKHAIKLLSASETLTLEDAEAFGKRFGVCVVCSRLLTDPKSVARGIGPVCARRWS